MLPRSRDAASHPSFASRFKKALPVPPLKEGRRSAERRTTGSAPPQKRKPASVCGEHHRFLPRTARDQSGGALAFRRPTAALRRGSYPSTRLRAALPGITGSKREDPLRHQCSQHLAVRSRAGRSMPKAARTRVTSPPPGTAPAPSIGCHRSTSLRWASLPDVTITGTNVKGSVTIKRQSEPQGVSACAANPSSFRRAAVGFASLNPPCNSVQKRKWPGQNPGHHVCTISDAPR